MLGARLALLLLFLCAAVVQLCAATPFQWAFTGNLNDPRDWHTATLLSDGRVLVAGGAGPRPQTFPFAGLASSELYDPVTGTWTVTGNLNEGRLLHTATLLPDGRVLVTGGWPDHTGGSGTRKRGTLQPGHGKLDRDREYGRSPHRPYCNIALPGNRYWQGAGRRLT